jgi:hypothetical protein
MSTPETIYLIPGEYEEGLVWCDDPAPDSYSDPGEAVKYVRADTLLINQSSFKGDVCTWELDHGDDAWLGTCGVYWSFIDEGPEENGLKFCPRCGKPCVFIELEAEEDDDD